MLGNLAWLDSLFIGVSLLQGSYLIFVASYAFGQLVKIVLFNLPSAQLVLRMHVFVLKLFAADMLLGSFSEVLQPIMVLDLVHIGYLHPFLVHALYASLSLIHI